MPRPIGLKKTGGRKAGVRNKLTRAVVAAAAATGRLPHDLLLAMARGQSTPGVSKPTRQEIIQARVAAAPFYAPRLSTVDVKAKAPGELTFALVLEMAKQNPKNRHKPREQ